MMYTYSEVNVLIRKVGKLICCDRDGFLSGECSYIDFSQTTSDQWTDLGVETPDLDVNTPMAQKLLTSSRCKAKEYLSVLRALQMVRNASRTSCCRKTGRIMLRCRCSVYYPYEQRHRMQIQKVREFGLQPLSIRVHTSNHSEYERNASKKNFAYGIIIPAFSWSTQITKMCWNVPEERYSNDHRWWITSKRSKNLLVNQLLMRMKPNKRIDLFNPVVG